MLLYVQLWFYRYDYWQDVKETPTDVVNTYFSTLKKSSSSEQKNL